MITSILFFKECNNMANLNTSLINIKTYLEKFISYHLVTNNMILLIPLHHGFLLYNIGANFNNCYPKNNGTIKNIYKQFKHVRFLTNMKKQALWNNWINIY